MSQNIRQVEFQQFCDWFQFCFLELRRGDFVPSVFLKRSYRIALIEDDLEMREMITEYLGSQFDVDSFSEPNAFLQSFTQHSSQYSLIISDIHLPEVSGLELLQIIKKNSHHHAFMIISASSQIDDQMEAIRLGADAFLKKPFRMSQLMETAQRIVQEH